MRLLALLGLITACAQAPLEIDRDAQGEPILATVPYDVVVLLREGRETAGDPGLFIEHANFRYTFAAPEHRQAFAADPDRFAVQQGGACGRMGALSGTGSPRLHAVHEGKLYFFASEGCREGFLAAPESVVAPLMDPIITAGTNEALLAHELLTKSLDFLGGAEAVDGAQLDWSLQTEQEYGGVNYQVRQREVVGPGARYRYDSAWNDDESGYRLADGAGSLSNSSSGTRTAQLAQVREMERRHQAHLLAVYQQRDGEHTYLCAEPGEAGVEILHISVQGIGHRIGVERETGRIVWHEYLGVGPEIHFGTVRDSFRAWEVQDGIAIPIGWTRSFEGEEVAQVHRGDEGWRVKVRR